MSSPLLSSLQFRHIIIPAEAQRRRRIINVAAGEPARPVPPGPLLSDADAEFVQWLFTAAGLDVAHYRAETLQRRLPACLRALRARTPAHAQQVLADMPALVPVALSALLVGITTFFRDPPVFDFLRLQVLPELRRGRRGLHVWSAGCSDGAELYSVALLLAEMGLLSGSYLLGTDCRSEALARARLGWYDAATVKEVPPPLLVRYFQPEDCGWRVRPELARYLRWRTGDVLKRAEPGLWDVILFRNTAMYLRPEAVAPLWERFEQALRPGGVLVLGKAERPSGARRLSPLGPCVYRRHRG